MNDETKEMLTQLRQAFFLEECANLSENIRAVKQSLRRLAVFSEGNKDMSERWLDALKNFNESCEIIMDVFSSETSNNGGGWSRLTATIYTDRSDKGM